VVDPEDYGIPSPEDYAEVTPEERQEIEADWEDQDAKENDPAILEYLDEEYAKDEQRRNGLLEDSNDD
jgi:hypothetical protein